MRLTELAAQERLVVRSVFTAPGATFPFGTHVAAEEVDTQTGKALVFDRRTNPVPHFTLLSETHQSKSVCYVPLMSRDRVLGVPYPV